MTTTKIKIYALILLGIVHLIISFSTVVPGHLLIDEATNHMMTKYFAETGKFEIWNGYREYPSPEFTSTLWVVEKKGHLVPQYPYLFAVLSTPFYWIWGYKGLFYLNALALIGVVFLCYQIAMKLFSDQNLALNSCLILILATYSWEYSQSAWAHSTTILFLLISFYLFLMSFQTSSDPPQSHSGRKKVAIWGILAGVVAGFAVGIRLDSVFFIPAIMLPFLFKPFRPKLILAVGIGLLPGLAVLSYTNYLKFGTIFPFSVGQETSFWGLARGVKIYFPFMTAVLILMILLWAILTYQSMIISQWKKIKPHKNRILIIISISIVVILAFAPQILFWLGLRLRNIYQIIADFRILDINSLTSGMDRSLGGGIVYIDGLKKSLLQSCPYLIILIVPLIKIFRRHQNDIDLFILLLVPIVYLSFFSYRAWHGGLSLNLRYLLPIFPFTSILTAYVWRDKVNNKEIYPLVMIAGGLTIGIYLLMQYPIFSETVDLQEFPYLTLPLLLALSILLTLIVNYSKYNSKILEKTLAFLLIMSLIWSGLVAFCYDYPRIREHRQFNLEIARQVKDVITDNAIIFTLHGDPFLILKEKGQIRIANPRVDNFADFPDLIHYHLQRNHGVYVYFSDWWWENVEKRKLLEGFKSHPLLNLEELGGIFAEIKPDIQKEEF